MEKLKNTDKKASAQRERLEKLPMSLLSFQNKTILVWSNQTRIF
ncbi:hypothetical protein HMPREF9965_1785 [Streptococcus mitis bv. 2 str. SK95]|uniref:Uncharacterized protein n=1 Tax=Streptococcus mitis bv. 2 str. SK95 TaxID=1000588 RepID=F9LWI7_STROR|nr:hypothetical protein [Streptococcus mitis]EGU67462.1 hypothetical protein HMPREF9965_1785 [Streptococcus mitis bv. 2 str. SK95]